MSGKQYTVPTSEATSGAASKHCILVVDDRLSVDMRLHFPQTNRVDRAEPPRASTRAPKSQPYHHHPSPPKSQNPSPPRSLQSPLRQKTVMKTTRKRMYGVSVDAARARRRTSVPGYRVTAARYGNTACAWACQRRRKICRSTTSARSAGRRSTRRR